MNVMFMLKGEPRWSMIDKNSWDMILGKAGKLPGTLAPEIVELAKKNNYEFFEGNPQDNYPNELDHFIALMKENNWERGKDDEELFEFAMHDRQYRDYKSGAAKERFLSDLHRVESAAHLQRQRPRWKSLHLLYYRKSVVRSLPGVCPRGLKHVVAGLHYL